MSFPSTNDMLLLRGPVPLAHLFLRRFVAPGDHVVDATCGNGRDTLLLADLVGSGGRVWAFDIQQEAIEATACRLAAAGSSGSVVLVHGGHESMAAHCSGPVKAVVFNLGYLPGGDRTVFTRPESTLAALEQALEILEPGGVVTISLYPGHEGGRQERTTLEEWSARLLPNRFHVWRMGQLNVTPEAPFFILIQKAV